MQGDAAFLIRYDGVDGKLHAGTQFQGSLLRVLIVDGLPLVRAALGTYVKHWCADATIMTAESFRAALRFVDRVPFDIALIDWHLPERGGPRMLRMLREAQPETCVVILSGRPEVSQEATRAHADIFISKGEPPDRLHELLEGYRHGQLPTHRGPKGVVGPKDLKTSGHMDLYGRS